MTLYQIFEIVKANYPEVNKTMFLNAYNSAMRQIAEEVKIKNIRLSFTTNADQMLYLFDKNSLISGSADYDMTNISKITDVNILSNGYLYKAVYVLTGLIPVDE